ncbi:kyphoscoliosis peptidase [Brachionus plicatilis]|uniref:Kyphoscoliosis peptidase n=1 Tax=Brachionus plicatilis TaxID=10195 RepID=A0A3M7QWS7_BRAPC|nr:kyphoscoliosis peptidase [Brachionus plicatilis]
MGCWFSGNKVSDVTEPITVKKWPQTEHLISLEWPELPDYLNSKSNLMAHALAKKRENFQQLDQVSLYLDSFPSDSDIERVWLIFAWIADNITYNFEGFKKGEYGTCQPQDIIECGHTVCSGYANLFQSLCQNMGIECRTITGYSKSYGYEPGKKFQDTDHAWNAVKIANKWYYIETTWASGTIDEEKFEKKFNPYWFFTPPDIFSQTHFSTEFQLEKKSSLQEFEKAHLNELEYFIKGFNKLSLPSLIETNHSPFCLELTCTKDCDLIAHLVNPSTDKPISMHVQKDSGHMPHKHCIFVEIPEKNVKYKLRIFAKNTHSDTNFYAHITSYELMRKKDEINRKMAQYNLDFGHGIKLLSHATSYLYFDHNPLRLELSGADSCSMIAELSDHNDVKLERACLIQKSVDRKNKDGAEYGMLTKFVLIKERAAWPNDVLSYVSLDDREAFVVEPLGYYLKKGVEYEFKVCLERVVKMALIDQEENWHHFQNCDRNLFVLKWCANKIGTVDVFAQFTEGSKFYSICNYEFNDLINPYLNPIKRISLVRNLSLWVAEPYERDVMLWYAAARGLRLNEKLKLDWSKRKNRQSVYRSFETGYDQYLPLLGTDLGTQKKLLFVKIRVGQKPNFKVRIVKSQTKEMLQSLDLTLTFHHLCNVRNKKNFFLNLKIISLNATWCNIHGFINLQNLLMMCKISVQSTLVNPAFDISENWVVQRKSTEKICFIK